MARTLIIIRHAHRDKDLGREIDNGLSEKGREQSLKLLKHFQKSYRDASLVFASSPKKRCVETLLPLVDNNRSRIKILHCLDEGGLLEAKVDQFSKWWDDHGADLTVVCSHGDWIPVCIERLAKEKTDLKKGAWARLQGKDRKMKLVEIIQKF